MLSAFHRTIRLSTVNYRHIRSFHSGIWSAKRVTEVVPPLGESITEGSIAKWSKSEGENVNPDDVIVVVETDKVTVDIKANFRGVITKHLAKENVEVGKPLYEIEVDESATGVVTSSTAAATAAAPAPTASSSDNNKPTHGHRQPSIRFLGKRSLLPKQDKHSHSPSVAQTPAAAVPASSPTATSSFAPVPSWAAPKKPQTGVDFHTLKDSAFHGRPKLSAKEIAAIESGGAF